MVDHQFLNILHRCEVDLLLPAPEQVEMSFQLPVLPLAQRIIGTQVLPQKVQEQGHSRRPRQIQVKIEHSNRSRRHSRYPRRVTERFRLHARQLVANLPREAWYVFITEVHWNSPALRVL